MSKSELTEEQIQEAITLYRDGHKISVIEDRSGLTRAQLYYQLEKRNIMPTKQKRPLVDARKVAEMFEKQIALNEEQKSLNESQLKSNKAILKALKELTANVERLETAVLIDRKKHG